LCCSRFPHFAAKGGTRYELAERCGLDPDHIEDVLDELEELGFSKNTGCADWGGRVRRVPRLFKRRTTMTNDMQELAAKEDQMRIDKILNQAFEQGKERFDNGKLPPFLVAFTDAFINDEDGIKEPQGLLWKYINADEAKRNDIDQVVMALCGYSVPRLAAVGLKMAEGRDFNAAFAATEEDGFGIAMAHILMHRLKRKSRTEN
jgi:hypothetical protein